MSWSAASARWEVRRPSTWRAGASGSPAHDRGSSHGRTRIIRLGYFEHPSYVPLLRHAYGLWRVERAAGRALLHVTVTGIAEIGPPNGALVKGTLGSARIPRFTP